MEQTEVPNLVLVRDPGSGTWAPPSPREREALRLAREREKELAPDDDVRRRYRRLLRYARADDRRRVYGVVIDTEEERLRGMLYWIAQDTLPDTEIARTRRQSGRLGPRPRGQPVGYQRKTRYRQALFLPLHTGARSTPMGLPADRFGEEARDINSPLPDDVQLDSVYLQDNEPDNWTEATDDTRFAIAHAVGEQAARGTFYVRPGGPAYEHLVTFRPEVVPGSRSKLTIQVFRNASDELFLTYLPLGQARGSTFRRVFIMPSPLYLSWRAPADDV